MAEPLPTLVENSLQIAWDYLDGSGELADPQLGVPAVDIAVASIVFYPACLIDPHAVEQDPIVDAAVRGSSKPLLLLADVHRHADLQDAMRKRPGAAMPT